MRTTPTRCAASPTLRPSNAALVALWLLSLGAAGHAQEDAPWELAGRQGLIQVVIVPPSQATDRDAYARQVKRLCAAGQTCFVNFFTNSTAAPVTLPLPEAISSEATAIYRHSVKQGAELFRWSCRLSKDASDCF